MLDKAGKGVLTDESSDIAYYEPDGKGNWRICREDKWILDISRPEDRPPKLQARKLSIQYRASNATLSKISQGFWLSSSKQYYFDAKGRLEHISEWYFEDGDKTPKIEICHHYDDKDRVILLLSPITTQSCAGNPPDARDIWARYHFGKYPGTDSFYKDEEPGDDVRLWDETNSGEADGTWKKGFRMFTVGTGDDTVHGAANADSRRG